MRELGKLQERHRLGMHIWEREPAYRYPHTTHDFFSYRQDHFPSGAALRYGETPFLSMSLLPDTQSNTTFYPYNLDTPHPSPGYLVNLSQEDETRRPLIPRMHPETLMSGELNFHKNFNISDLSPIGVINRTLHKYGKNENTLIAFSQTPEGGRATEEMLDALGNHLARLAYSVNNATIPLNELLVSPSPSNIVAICVPYENKATEAKDSAMNAALITLSGALAGMQHLQKGFDLPVVYYNVSAFRKEDIALHPAGQLTWLGQGEDDFRRAAIEAIEVLQETGKHAQAESNLEANLKKLHFGPGDIFGNIAALKSEVKSTFGIDMTKPLLCETERNR